MAEFSMPWDGTSLGDATTAPYDGDTEWPNYTAIVCGIVAQTSSQGGVFLGAKNGGQAASASSPVTIDTMYAMCNGTMYQNTALVSVTVPTPASATRIDRIVLQKDWAAQTVRITRVAGVEGGGEPALVQNSGTLWQEPLWKTSIVTGGTITLTDERQCLGMRPGTIVGDALTVPRYPTSAWAECVGTAIVRAAYVCLTGLLLAEPTGAHPYGNGDGTTTINIPDKRGRVDAMYDASGAIVASFAAMGINLGTQTHTLTAGESGIATHQHNFGTLALGSMVTLNTVNGALRVLDSGSSGTGTYTAGSTLVRAWSNSDISAVTTGLITGATAVAGPTSATNALSLMQPSQATEKWIFLGGL